MKFADHPCSKLLLIFILCFLSLSFLTTTSSDDTSVKPSIPEKKEIKAGEFVFDIKDGKLWLEAKEADLNEVLKTVEKRAGIGVDKEIKEKLLQSLF